MWSKVFFVVSGVGKSGFFWFPGWGKWFFLVPGVVKSVFLWFPGWGKVFFSGFGAVTMVFSGLVERVVGSSGDILGAGGSIWRSSTHTVVTTGFVVESGGSHHNPVGNSRSHSVVCCRFIRSSGARRLSCARGKHNTRKCRNWVTHAHTHMRYMCMRPDFRLRQFGSHPHVGGITCSMNSRHAIVAATMYTTPVHTPCRDAAPLMRMLAFLARVFRPMQVGSIKLVASHTFCGKLSA